MNTHVEISKRAAVLIEKLREAQSTGPEWMFRLATVAIANIEDIRHKAENGTLPRTYGGGFGITRALGEWAPNSVLDAAHDLEGYIVDFN